MDLQAQTMLDDVAELVEGAQSILFITGAGLSADSGLPTYRGITGLYQDTPLEEGLTIEQALSGATFEETPAITWKYLQRLRESGRQAAANPGHAVIAALEQARPRRRVWVLTQNVDGLHRDAGSHQVIDIHGNLNRLRCTWCPQRIEVARHQPLAALPHCSQCGGPMRPDVVLFGEQLPEPEVAVLERELRRGFDLVFSVGTSSLFPYIVAPIVRAHLMGIPTVEINPEPTPASPFVRHRIPMGAAEALLGLWHRLPASPPKRSFRARPLHGRRPSYAHGSPSF